MRVRKGKVDKSYVITAETATAIHLSVHETPAQDLMLAWRTKKMTAAQKTISRPLRMA